MKVIELLWKRHNCDFNCTRVTIYDMYGANFMRFLTRFPTM